MRKGKDLFKVQIFILFILISNSRPPPKMRGEGGDQNNYYLQKDGHGIAGGDLEEIQNPFPLYTGIAGLQHDLSDLVLEQSLIFAPVFRNADVNPGSGCKSRARIFPSRITDPGSKRFRIPSPIRI